MRFIDYIRGIRKGKNAHHIEHDAMSDPFLSDAIEGYDSIEGNHIDRIAEMQTRVLARTSTTKKQGVWKIAAAAIVIIALLGGYFSLMNHQSRMLVANETDSSFIALYAPESYIERKNRELAELEDSGDTSPKVTAVVDIVNLHEVIRPEERINLYVPDVYYAQLNKKEQNELATAKEKEAHPYAETDLLDNDYSLKEEVPVLAQSATIKEVAEADIAMVAQSVSDNMINPEVTRSRHLTGKVVDENNEPLIGATITIKGTNKGTATDINGNYNIQIGHSDSAHLIAQYIGYETIEIPKAKENQTIAMKENKQVLDEVVIVGYSTQRKRSVTGSVSTIESKKLKEIKPQPIIGEKEYKKYLSENLIRPDQAECKKGKVELEFDIDSSGRPINITITRSICDAFDDEAIRLVEEGPDWISGTTRAKVEVKF